MVHKFRNTLNVPLQKYLNCFLAVFPHWERFFILFNGPQMWPFGDSIPCSGVPRQCCEGALAHPPTTKTPFMFPDWATASCSTMFLWISHHVLLQTPAWDHLLSPSDDCKYKFGPWGPCDAATNTKSRSGTLKKVLFNADCQNTVKVSKPCSPKVKKGRDEKNKRKAF